MTFTYSYPRPSLTVDIILIAKKGHENEILLIRRKSDPYKGKWALPGGFMDMQETLIEAAARELKEETGVDNIDLNQFYVFDAPDRDPRGRTVSVVHYGFTDELLAIKGADDAEEAKWFSLTGLPELAFDHHQIISKFLSEALISPKVSINSGDQ